MPDELYGDASMNGGSRIGDMTPSRGAGFRAPGANGSAGPALAVAAVRPGTARGRVLVTGAGGFIGRHACAALAREGWTVRALTRRSRAPRGAAEYARHVDLQDRAGARAALEGVDAVIHLAARVHRMRDAGDTLAAYRRVNVDGTRTLIEEAIAAGVRRFVFASSVRAMGEATAPGHAWDETTEPVPVDPYGLSKHEAECVVAALAAESGLVATTLRLPLVHGPSVGGNLLRLVHWIDRGLPLPIGAVDSRRSLLYAGNLSTALAHVLEAPAERVAGTFFVKDGQDVATAELARRIGQLLGRPARIVSVPVTLLDVVARAGDLFRGRVRFLPTSRLVARLTGSLVVDDRRLRATGWTPPFTLDDGLRATAAAYLRRRGRTP